MRAEHHINHVAILRRKVLPLVRAAGIHHRRKRLLDRLRLQIAFLYLVETAFEIERLVARPQLLQDVQPLGGAIVAVIVLHQRRAEHLDLRPVPAGDDVEREAAAGDMVDGRRLLGRHHRVDGRYMRGGEDAGIMGRGAHRRSPGKALEARAIEVGDAAETVPAADRHQSFEFH